MVVVDLLSIDLVESVDLVTVILVVNCITCLKGFLKLSLAILELISESIPFRKVNDELIKMQAIRKVVTGHT